AVPPPPTTAIVAPMRPSPDLSVTRPVAVNCANSTFVPRRNNANTVRHLCRKLYFITKLLCLVKNLINSIQQT
ncbi:MAG: hypothetical protein Q8K92_03460, partial [Leadbetterella sp.]|nr:hypothetical protein [Leadbetterella sp.]